MPQVQGRAVRTLVLRGAEVVVWWAAGFGVWLVSLSALSPGGIALGAAVSAPCALAPVACRLVVGGRWSFTARMVRLLAPAPIQILTDAIQVLVLPWRAHPDPGGFSEIDSGLEGDSGPVVATRVTGVVAASVSPGSFVVDARPDGRFIIHECVPRGMIVDRLAK